MFVRDGVVIQIEAHVRCLTDMDLDALVGDEGLLRQRQQSGLLLGECLADAARAVFAPEPIGGHTRGPLLGLSVELIEVGPFTSREEAVSYVADRSLDAPLLIAPRDCHRTWLVAIVFGELDDSWIEANRIADALEHSTF